MKIFANRFDTRFNPLVKYCYATLADLYPCVEALGKEPVGTKSRFACRDHGIVEIELERMTDEPYNPRREWTTDARR